MTSFKLGRDKKRQIFFKIKYGGGYWMDVFRYSKNETFSYKYNTISTILDFKGRIVLATMYMD